MCAVSPRSPANGMRLAVLIVVIQCKADLEGDLVMRDLAVFDMAARLHHFKPANLAQRARGAADAVLNRVLNTFFRRPGDLNDAVYVIGHRLSPCDKALKRLSSAKGKTTARGLSPVFSRKN